MKKIVNTGTDTFLNHRGDFETCPDCGHFMKPEKWDDAATTLVLTPRCYKAGNVAILSECPKCKEQSWVHHSMDRFSYYSGWPKEWKERIQKVKAATKLKALRDWGKSLCWKCQNLEEATVEYHCYRTCTIGMGESETKCDHFKQIKNL